MSESLPKKLFHHIAVTGFIGMGVCVAVRHNGSPQTSQPPTIVGKCITKLTFLWDGCVHFSFVVLTSEALAKEVLFSSSATTSSAPLINLQNSFFVTT